MNNLLKFGIRSCLKKPSFPKANSIKCVLNTNNSMPVYSRTLWHMCSTSKINGDILKVKPISECCQCGCSGLMHTGGEKDLVEFLKEEIVEEKKIQKMQSLPSELNGFAIYSDMAELTFEKKTSHETITVSMNINHSVDTEEMGEGENEEMKAKPSFDVDITRNKKTLSFSCSFTHFDDVDAQSADVFEINEVTYFEGDYEDKVYSVAADLLDENLYDLFMVVLGEKGITKKFVEEVSEIATLHEHMQYIGFLNNVKKFASAN